MIRFDKHVKQVNQGEQNRLLHHPYMYLQPTQTDHFKESFISHTPRSIDLWFVSCPDLLSTFCLLVTYIMWLHVLDPPVFQHAKAWGQGYITFSTHCLYLLSELLFLLLDICKKKQSNQIIRSLGSTNLSKKVTRMVDIITNTSTFLLE